MADKKTKILAVGDVHGDSRLIKKLAEQAKKYGFKGKVFTADSTALVKEYVENLLDEKTILLVKGSMMDTELIGLAKSLKMKE